MVLPLIPIAIIAAGALVGVGTAFSGDEISTTTHQTTTQTTNNIVRTDFIIGESATVGGITVDPTFSTSNEASLRSDPTTTTSKGVNPLLLAAAGAAALWVVNN